MLVWYESDGVTPLSALNFGKVGPGEDYYTKNASAYLQVVLKNDGAASLADVAVEILQVSTFPFNQYLRVAVGPTVPAPGAFVDYTAPDLALGTIAPAGTVNLWFNLVVPAQANRGAAQFASVRAYGTEA